jgi:hypothetical protein
MKLFLLDLGLSYFRFKFVPTTASCDVLIASSQHLLIHRIGFLVSIKKGDKYNINKYYKF